MHFMSLHLLLAALLSLLPWAALAQAVALTGISGSKALVVIDGAAPRFLSPGQAHQGVTLLSVNGDAATLQVGGERKTLRVGESPVSLGQIVGADGGRRVVMTADASGHFMPQGQINGRSVQFLVDTGASVIAIGAGEARRLNIPFENGQKVGLSTANGNAVGYQIRLGKVQVGDVVVYDVPAVVTPQSMPFVLLGNSFLNRFQMQRSSDQLTLEKRF